MTSQSYVMPRRVDFTAVFAETKARLRQNQLRGRKRWVEEWFADQMGMTVKQWREAQARVRGLTMEQVTP